MTQDAFVTNDILARLSRIEHTLDALFDAVKPSKPDPLVEATTTQAILSALSGTVGMDPLYHSLARDMRERKTPDMRDLRMPVIVLEANQVWRVYNGSSFYDRHIVRLNRTPGNEITFIIPNDTDEFTVSASGFITWIKAYSARLISRPETVVKTNVNPGEHISDWIYPSGTVAK